MDDLKNLHVDSVSDLAGQDAEKGVWAKPEIIDFKPVTVARGISYRIGDGISNLC